MKANGIVSGILILIAIGLSSCQTAARHEKCSDSDCSICHRNPKAEKLEAYAFGAGLAASGIYYLLTEGEETTELIGSPWQVGTDIQTTSSTDGKELSPRIRSQISDFSTTTTPEIKN